MNGCGLILVAADGGAWTRLGVSTRRTLNTCKLEEGGGGGVNNSFSVSIINATRRTLLCAARSYVII